MYTCCTEQVLYCKNMYMYTCCTEQIPSIVHVQCCAEEVLYIISIVHVHVHMLY